MMFKIVVAVLLSIIYHARCCVAGLDGEVTFCLFSWFSLKCGKSSINVRTDKHMWGFVLFMFRGRFRLGTVNKFACLILFKTNFLELVEKAKNCCKLKFWRQIIVLFKCTGGHNDILKLVCRSLKRRDFVHGLQLNLVRWLRVDSGVVGWFCYFVQRFTTSLPKSFTLWKGCSFICLPACRRTDFLLGMRAEYLSLERKDFLAVILVPVLLDYD